MSAVGIRGGGKFGGPKGPFGVYLSIDQSLDRASDHHFHRIEQHCEVFDNFAVCQERAGRRAVSCAFKAGLKVRYLPSEVSGGMSSCTTGALSGRYILIGKARTEYIDSTFDPVPVDVGSVLAGLAGIVLVWLPD